MKTYYDITIDLYDLYPLKKIEAQQNNVGRGARITLTAGGLVLGLDGESVTMWAKKPDGTVSYLACSVVDGKIQADFTSQMLAAPGDVQVELRLINGEENITTPIFSVHVRKSNINDSAAESTNEFTALASMVAEVNEMKKTALKGDPGEAATLEIGTVEASEPGSAPSVTNSGTAQEAILNFILPRGQTGPEGPAGQTQIHFSAAAEFPAAGNSTMLYVDNTVSPAIIYTWTGNAYVQASADISTVMAMLATPYDPDQDYTAGQYVTYNKQYWKFTATKSAGEWDASKAVATNVGTEISALNANKDGTLSFSYYPTDSVKWCKVGNVVTISNLDDIQDIPAGGWNEIGTLPSDIRPRFTFVVRSSTNMNLAYRFYPSGVVTVYNYGNAVSGVINGSFFATYVT